MNKITKILASFALCVSFMSSAKVLIFTYSYNRPDFIEIQYKTFKKFLLDDYEFMVFNDATDEHMRIAIEQMCAQYSIRCIRIPQEIHDPTYNASVRNCKVVNYSLKTVGFSHEDIVVLLDSDLFLVNEFSIKEYMKNYDVAGQWQSRGHVHYLWIGLVFLNMATMPNKDTIDFGLGFIDGFNTDSGGRTHYYLKNNPTAHIKWLDNVTYLSDLTCDNCKTNQNPICSHHLDRMQQLEFSQPLIHLAQLSRSSNSEIYLKNTFLHYRAGSNWNYESLDFHEKKTKQLLHFLIQLGIE